MKATQFVLAISLCCFLAFAVANTRESDWKTSSHVARRTESLDLANLDASLYREHVPRGLGNTTSQPILLVSANQDDGIARADSTADLTATEGEDSKQAAPPEYLPNNLIMLASDQNDGSYLHFQKIHTTIDPPEEFVMRDGRWSGEEPDWEGEAYNVQTRYVSAWSIEVHYDDAGVSAEGTWKHSNRTGNDYGVFIGKHIPSGLAMPHGFAARDELQCMLSRKYDPGPDADDYPANYWHDRDWDFVEAEMSGVLNAAGIHPPWDHHSRRELVSTLGKWIKDTRLTGHGDEQNLHPVDFLEGRGGYCGGAAGTLVAMCSILKIPARYIGTWDHALVEYQDDDGDWRLVENQPDLFVAMAANRIGTRARTPATTRARDLAADFRVGLIDVIADPKSCGLPELPQLGWYYNWSCPFLYDKQGVQKDVDLCVRPQTLHDWVFNLYTGYGGYEGDCIHKRGFFMAERFDSVYELAALYAPRRDDLPYVCGKRSNNDNIIYLTPFRDSYYAQWNNKTRIASGPGQGVRKQFYLSELDGVTKVVAAIILGPDQQVDHDIPRDGGSWYYRINGKKYPLASHGGFRTTTNYNGTGMTVHRFEIPIGDLITGDPITGDPITGDPSE